VLALLIGLRREVADYGAPWGRRTSAPDVPLCRFAAAYLFERPIEQRLARPARSRWR
jgi:hypothetical protein